MTRAEGVAKMTAFAERQPTGVLCRSLALLDHGGLTQEERLTRAVLMDVICERHPEADAAFDAWAESPGADSAAGAMEAITIAAIEAARKAGRP